MNFDVYNPLNLPAEFLTGGATLDDAVRYHAALSDFYSAHKELLEAHPTEFYTRNQLDLLSQYADELRLIPQMHRLLTRPAGGPGALSAYFSEAQRLAMAREAKSVGVEAMPIGRDLRSRSATRRTCRDSSPCADGAWPPASGPCKSAIERDLALRGPPAGEGTAGALAVAPGAYHGKLGQ